LNVIFVDGAHLYHGTPEFAPWETETT